MVKEVSKVVGKTALKRKAPSTITDPGPSTVESEAVTVSVDTVPSTDATISEEIKEEKHFVFKKQSFNYVLKTVTKTRDSHISAPPSFKPATKYSDISGLVAKYTDPQTKLQYAMAEEFSTVRSLPSDIISGYLSLRGVNSVIG